MAENEVQDQDTGTPEPSDEDVWESVAEEDSEGNLVEAESEEEQETETEEAGGGEPVVEDNAETDQTDEEDPEEETQHDFEKRYKDLEKEFHKRNESTKELKEGFDEMRLQLLERDKEIDGLRQKTEQVAQEPDPSDPEVLDNFFDEDDKETMEEFGELTKTFRKVVQHELAKAQKGTPAEDDSVERIEKLESAAQQYMYEKFLAGHEKDMIKSVGSFYTELDRDSDFQKFVLDSPALTQMMTQSTESKDHAAVMNLYLNQPGLRELWDDSSKTLKSDPTPSPKKQQRRVAATGAVKNSAPRMEKNTANMNDDDLWESIPEQEAEFT